MHCTSTWKTTYLTQGTMHWVNFSVSSHLSHVDISGRFSVTRSTASCIFLSVIDMLYSRLQPLIIFLDSEEVVKSIPMCFRANCGTKVVVIIDCFYMQTVKSPCSCCQVVFLQTPQHGQAILSDWHYTPRKYIFPISYIGWQHKWQTLKQALWLSG